MDRRKRKLFVAVTAPKIVRFSLCKDQHFSWWFLSHSAEVQISRMQNAEVFFWPHSIVSSQIYSRKYRNVLISPNAVLAGAPKATTNKLQRVLNAAAGVVSGTHKFDRGLS